jgi:hypothetical protein
MKRRDFITAAITIIGTPIISIKIFDVPLPWQKKKAEDPDLERIPILREGQPVPQIFVAKVPIDKYNPGEQIGFEVTDMLWQHPFWFVAAVRQGYAVCDLSAGNPLDVGRIYKIRGLRLPPGVNIPTKCALDGPVHGTPFFGPSFHRRV